MFFLESALKGSVIALFALFTFAHAQSLSLISDRDMALSYEKKDLSDLRKSQELPQVQVKSETKPETLDLLPAAPLAKQDTTKRDLLLFFDSPVRKAQIREPYAYSVFDQEYEIKENQVPVRRFGVNPKTRLFEFYALERSAQKDEKTEKNKRTILDNNSDMPMILRAERIQGRPEREFYLDELAEIERGQTRMSADHAIIRQDENEIELSSNADVTHMGERFKAKHMVLNADLTEGVMKNASYEIGDVKGRGRASDIHLEDEYNTTLMGSIYTTCDEADPDWYLSASTITLDKARNVGTAKSPTLYFKHVPILAAPSIWFPLSGERRSGVLPPTIGATSKSGFEIGVPYYLNLAPNYDLTLYPKYYTKRGFQLGANARYLGKNYEGETYVDYLPSDKDAHRKRYSIASKHVHHFLPGWTYQWDFNKASDDNYPDDFSNDMLRGSRVLLQHGYVTYNHEYLDMNYGASRYQILQDKKSPIAPIYDRLPYIDINAHAYDVKGFDFVTELHYTRYWLSNDKLAERPIEYRYRGSRYVAKPSIAFPIVGNSYFFKPKGSLHYTRYDLDKTEFTRGQSRELTRTIPTFSLDTGLIFDRQTSLLGPDMRQTLEPRLFYVFTPYKKQDHLPVFDSGEPTFGYTQLFSENRFVGEDRISDANNLTTAVTSRFIEQSGIERMSFTVGQRFYFDDQKVSIYRNTREQEKRNQSRSDILLMANGLITPKLAVDATLQYDQSKSRTSSANYSLQWRPADRKIFNIEYNYLRRSMDQYVNDGRVYNNNKDNKIDQINVSAQWPLSDRVYGVGMWSYSLPDSKTIESLFGIEYNANCWIGRLVAQRYVTSSSKTNTAFYFQLELKGLSKLGSNPIDKLRRGISGYRPLTSED